MMPFLTMLAVSKYPSIGECVMCTVTGYKEDIGFDVRLDEYGVPALIMAQDLSSKKIKKNVAAFLKIDEQFPVVVLHVHDNGSLITVSKKDIKATEIKSLTEYYGANQRLITAARRLSHMSADKSQDLQNWEHQFRELLRTYLDDNEKGENMEEHPYNLLLNRETMVALPMAPAYLDLIKERHSDLFGVQIWTERRAVTIQSYRVDGNEFVKSVFAQILAPFAKVYSNTELYEDQTRCNVSVLPIAIPKFEIVVRCYTSALATKTMDDIVKSLEAAQFDYLM